MGEGPFGDLEASIGRASEMFARLDGAIERTGELFATLGSGGGLGDLTARVDGIGEAWDRAAAGAARYRDAATQSAASPLESDLPPPSRGPRPDRDEEPSIFGGRDDYANARYENSDYDQRRDQQRRAADYENDEYDRRERQRVREAQADEDYDAPSRRGSSGGGGHGGLGGVFQGMEPLIEAVTAFKSEQSAMKENLAVMNTLIEGLHITPEQGQQQFEQAGRQLREIAAEASRGTIYSEAQAAEAMPVMARELGFTGQEGMQKFSQIFRPALQAAEVAQQTGLGGLDSSLSASVEYAHMTGSYEPEQLEKHLNVLRSIAQLTNQTMHGEEGILKYSVPIGMAGGMDPDQAAIQTGFLQQQGFNSSTAGTGLSALILGALNTGGGLNSHLEQTRRQGEHAFADALHLDPKQAAEEHGGRGSAHTRALENLGITRGGQLTTVDDRGNFDIGKLQADIREYAATHSRQDSLNAFHDAFGTRGERIAAVYAEQDSGVRERRFADAVMTSPTARQIQGDLSQAPLQQFEQMVANIANIGNTLANPTLSGLNAAFHTLNAGLDGLNSFLRGHPEVTKPVGYAAEAGLGAGAVGITRWVWNGITGAGKGVVGAVADEAPSVGRAAGGVGSWIAGGATGVLAEITTDLIGNVMADRLTDRIYGPGTAERWHKDDAAAAAGHPAITAGPHVSLWGNGGLGSSSPGNWQGAAPVTAATAPAASASAAAPAAPASTPVHVGPVQISVQPTQDKDSMIQEIVRKFHDVLSFSLSNTSGPGVGSNQSAYVTGGMLP